MVIMFFLVSEESVWARDKPKQSMRIKKTLSKLEPTRSQRDQYPYSHSTFITVISSRSLTSPQKCAQSKRQRKKRPVVSLNRTRSLKTKLKNEITSCAVFLRYLWLGFLQIRGEIKKKFQCMSSLSFRSLSFFSVGILVICALKCKKKVFFSFQDKSCLMD